MARNKQSARKSPGRIAPRKQLATKAARKSRSTPCFLVSQPATRSPSDCSDESDGDESPNEDDKIELTVAKAEEATKEDDEIALDEGDYRKVTQQCLKMSGSLNEKFVAAVREWNLDMAAPSKFYVKLQHPYSTTNLTFGGLKGADKVMVDRLRALKDSRENNDSPLLKVFCVIFAKHESGYGSRHNGMEDVDDADYYVLARLALSK
jgi:hypothetical protein